MVKKVSKNTTNKEDYSSNSESESDNDSQLNDITIEENDDDIVDDIGDSDNDIEDGDADDDIDDENEGDDLEDDGNKKSKDKNNNNNNNNCFLNYLNDDESDNEAFDDYIVTEKEPLEVNNEDRISINRMTKYEYVRLLGTRTKQLSMGAKPLIKNIQNLNSKEIAILELKNNIIPLIIKRPLPNNTYEFWNIKELEKDHLYD